ncbi:MAG: hypothetical protein HY908_09975, partial [Myxococcales bacterium]|nr:hypothetical protein [Myxococcales bacterium]
MDRTGSGNERPGRRLRRVCRVGVGGVVLGLVALAAQGGCFPAATHSGPVGPVPPWLATQVGPSAPVPAASASPAAPAQPIPAATADPGTSVFDPASIVVVLDDPRLAAAKAALAREAQKGAADALEAALAGLAGDAPERPAWSYRLGLLRREAGEPLAAARAFDASAARAWPLADHARHAAAELYLAVGQPADARLRL